MTKPKHRSIPERLGRWTGRVWRAYICREAKALQWLQSKGFPLFLGKTLLWSTKLALVGVLLYAVFWLALILLFGIVAARLALVPSSSDEEKWAIGEQASHKDSVFYDPINYTDTPDPRFDDEVD